MIQTFMVWVPRGYASMDEAFESACNEERPSGLPGKSDYMTVDLRVAPISQREARDIAEAILPHGYDGPSEPAWVIDVPGEIGGWLFFGCAEDSKATPDEWIRG